MAFLESQPGGTALHDLCHIHEIWLAFALEPNGCVGKAFPARVQQYPTGLHAGFPLIARKGLLRARPIIDSVIRYQGIQFIELGIGEEGWLLIRGAADRGRGSYS